MTEPLKVIEPDGSVNGHDPGLSEEELRYCYRAMVRTRAFDAICLKLQRSGRIGFSIPNKGIEATQVGSASAIEKSDFLFPSYRDFGMALYHGVPMLEMMHNMYGNDRDSAKGRQMSVHFSFDAPIRFFSISSPIGTNIPQAVGAAYAMKHRGEKTVALVSFGDGGTSAIGFHSGMNFAGVWKVPVVFLCQNNQWAISCPAEEQTASENFAIKGKAYGIPGVVVDGNDVLAVRKTVVEAVERARSGGGPTLVEAKTFRLGGHSTADDPTKYVPAEQLEEWTAKDPLKRFEKYLEAVGLWTPEQGEAMYAEAEQEASEAAREAESVKKPGLETIFSDVYAEIPAHLRKQGQEAFDLARRKGDPLAGDGEFPL
ncbi:MAG: thiamine pyrophosphate-dependent enzyme [Planctomycetota bacterium]|nr:thiamine pyrophosphate-dependent enzyme [Planctomycetota bacterium]